MMFTSTGPRWLCQGNWAPGCTVYFTSTVRDGSSTLTTIVRPCSLSLNFMSISSGKTERGVSGSAAIGGGGSSAAEGTTLTAETAASIKSTVPNMSMTRLARLLPLIIDLLLSRWDDSPPPRLGRLAPPIENEAPFTLERHRRSAYGGRRPVGRWLPSCGEGAGT